MSKDQKMNFLSLFRKNNTSDLAEKLHEQLVEQARCSVFYTDFGVPDTVDGRFDMIVLHGFLVMQRLKAEGDVAMDLSQSIFDTMFLHMDISLREMGVGDLSVGKRIKKMATAFYGRVEAYDEPILTDDREELAKALSRNLYRDTDIEMTIALKMADYVLESRLSLRDQDLADIEANRLAFVDPDNIACRNEENQVDA
jgi:cytochrome b pre-mRNA-processing protein 3